MSQTLTLKSILEGFRTEFIVPQDGWKKQDCERTAVKRWLAEQHTHFGEGKITYLGDDLYANQPLCQLITA
jgi:hypothetical protein